MTHDHTSNNDQDELEQVHLFSVQSPGSSHLRLAFVIDGRDYLHPEDVKRAVREATQELSRQRVIAQHEEFLAMDVLPLAYPSWQQYQQTLTQPSNEGVPFPVFAGYPSWPQARTAWTTRLDRYTLASLDRAVHFALACHSDQRRPAGEPYAAHLLEVLQILVEGLGVTDRDTLVAAVCHDVVEDTPGTLAEIQHVFGPSVAAAVAVLTKPEPGPDDDAAQLKARYFARFATAPAAVLQIKLADRLSNVQRLDTHPRPDTQRRYYAETVTHFLPLAERVPWFARWFAEWRISFQYLE